MGFWKTLFGGDDDETPWHEDPRRPGNGGPISNLDDLEIAISSGLCVEVSLEAHSNWEEIVREKRARFQTATAEYRAELARRQGAPLASKVAEITGSMQVDIPSEPQLCLPDEPEPPSHEWLVRYDRAAQSIWEFCMRHPVRLNVYVVPEIRTVDGKIEFDGFMLRLSPEDKPYSSMDSPQYYKIEERHSKCVPYFHVLTLSRGEFSELARTRKLRARIDDVDRYGYSGSGRLEFDKSREAEMLDFIKMVDVRFREKGFYDYSILACEPETLAYVSPPPDPDA